MKIKSPVQLDCFYHFRSTLKRDDFFVYVHFSNLTVLSGYVSRLANETLVVMLRN